MQWLQESFSALTAETGPVNSTDTTVSTAGRTGVQDEGQLSREQLLTFFESASEIMKAEDFRRKLKDAKLLKQVETFSRMMIPVQVVC